ncbi:MAG: hypothetical protein GF355_07080 [Candidatus Eisenbacteria bacterium]|nr:hypothetical protein [Candidatus Eisenbacteria bacterium]
MSQERRKVAAWRVVNLAKYQHYRERRPPWIKLHVQILDSGPDGGEYALLSDSAWRLGIEALLWTASKAKPGEKPPSFTISELSWLLRRPVDEESLQELEDVGFMERTEKRASNMLASRLQSATVKSKSGTQRRAEESRDRDRDRGEEMGVLKTKHPRQLREDAKPTSVQVRKIFDHWVTACQKDPAKTKLSRERRSKIQARLRDCTEGEIIQAINGCAASPFHMGENDKGETYNELDLILRNRTQVEKFMARASNSKGHNDKEPEEIKRKREETRRAIERVRRGGS